jgi:hypothetical protein
MTGTINKRRSMLLITCLLLLVTGCALDAYRMHPEFDVRAGSIKTPVLISPDVYMYELSSDGMVMLRDDWSRAGRKNLQNAILRYFKDKQYSVKLSEMDSQTTEQMEEVQALYRLVHKAMDQYAFGHHQNWSNNHRFDFSIGSLEPILQKLDADGMIFVTGYDQIFKSGHKALIDVAVADSSGNILYYSVKGTTRGKDLRDPVSTASLIHDLLSSYPRMEG